MQHTDPILQVLKPQLVDRSTIISKGLGCNQKYEMRAIFTESLMHGHNLMGAMEQT